MKKSTAQRFHARKRSTQRLGYEMSFESLQEIATAIRTDPKPEWLRCVEVQSRTRTKWLVTRDGEKYYVVYDKKTKEIVTILATEDEIRERFAPDLVEVKL